MKLFLKKNDVIQEFVKFATTLVKDVVSIDLNLEQEYFVSEFTVGITKKELTYPKEFVLVRGIIDCLNSSMHYSENIKETIQKTHVEPEHLEKIKINLEHNKDDYLTNVFNKVVDLLNKPTTDKEGNNINAEIVKGLLEIWIHSDESWKINETINCNDIFPQLIDLLNTEIITKVTNQFKKMGTKEAKPIVASVAAETKVVNPNIVEEASLNPLFTKNMCQDEVMETLTPTSDNEEIEIPPYVKYIMAELLKEGYKPIDFLGKGEKPESRYDIYILCENEHGEKFICVKHILSQIFL